MTPNQKKFIEAFEIVKKAIPAFETLKTLLPVVETEYIKSSSDGVGAVQKKKKKGKLSSEEIRKIVIERSFKY